VMVGQQAVGYNGYVITPDVSSKQSLEVTVVVG
ncbi:unnamed protein product, partial [marine sediment metagenome]